MVEEDNEAEWDKILGILVLLLTLLGHSSSGVVANIVPASSGLVQMAQRSGFVLLASALPTYFEYQYYEEGVDWAQLFSRANLSYGLFCAFLQLMWQSEFIEGTQRTTQVQSFVLSNL